MLRKLTVLTIALAGLMAQTPQPTITPSPHPFLLGRIRAMVRAHQPPSPFVIYTITRKQLAANGLPDKVNSYSERLWARNVDHAALARRIFPAMGQPVFERPAFNADRDPGPPTADLFQPASDEASSASATVAGFDDDNYLVVRVATEGDQLHLTLTPVRDPERNCLRELWVDRSTLELTRIISHDRLFIPVQGSPAEQMYDVTFDIKIAMLQGVPVVTDIHGVVGDNYTGDGQIVDYAFRDIAFPQTLPDWYFDPRTYGNHRDAFPS